MVTNDTTLSALAEGTLFQALGAGEGSVALKVDSVRLFSCKDTTSALPAAVDALRSDLVALEGELTREGIVCVQ